MESVLFSLQFFEASKRKLDSGGKRLWMELFISCYVFFPWPCLPATTVPQITFTKWQAGKQGGGLVVRACSLLQTEVASIKQWDSPLSCRES